MGYEYNIKKSMCEKIVLSENMTDELTSHISYKSEQTFINDRKTSDYLYENEKFMYCIFSENFGIQLTEAMEIELHPNERAMLYLAIREATSILRSYGNLIESSSASFEESIIMFAGERLQRIYDKPCDYIDKNIGYVRSFIESALTGPLADPYDPDFMFLDLTNDR